MPLVGEDGDMTWFYMAGMVLVLIFFINWYLEQMAQVKRHDARKKRRAKAAGLQDHRRQPTAHDLKSAELKKND